MMKQTIIGSMVALAAATMVMAFANFNSSAQADFERQPSTVGSEAWTFENDVPDMMVIRDRLDDTP